MLAILNFQDAFANIWKEGIVVRWTFSWPIRYYDIRLPSVRAWSVMRNFAKLAGFISFFRLERCRNVSRQDLSKKTVTRNRAPYILIVELIYVYLYIKETVCWKERHLVVISMDYGELSLLPFFLDRAIKIQFPNFRQCVRSKLLLRKRRLAIQPR